jgi:DNA-binding transcriptional ArsR family regulator
MKIKSQISKTSKSLKSIADPARFAVIALLMKKEMYVGEIKKSLKIEATLLSHHLSILKDSGLVIAKREGKRVLYKLNPKLKIRGKARGIKLGDSKFIF